MGRLLEKLKVKCRACAHWHIARRISARYLDGDKKYFLNRCIIHFIISRDKYY